MLRRPLWRTRLLSVISSQILCSSATLVFATRQGKPSQLTPKSPLHQPHPAVASAPQHPRLQRAIVPPLSGKAPMSRHRSAPRSGNHARPRKSDYPKLHQLNALEIEAQALHGRLRVIPKRTLIFWPSPLSSAPLLTRDPA